jgi:hypothetical protein
MALVLVGPSPEKKGEHGDHEGADRRDCRRGRPRSELRRFERQPYRIVRYRPGAPSADDLTKISRAMGHSTTAMTEKYFNEAAFGMIGKPFEPLPELRPILG